MSYEACPLCERGSDESRAEAARRAEALAVRKPTAKNKRRARLGRACFEPLSERASKIFFLAEALKPDDEMDMSFHMPGDLGEPFEFADERARRLAREGARVEPGTPWWILENYRG